MTSMASYRVRLARLASLKTVTRETSASARHGDFLVLTVIHSDGSELPRTSS